MFLGFIFVRLFNFSFRNRKSVNEVFFFVKENLKEECNDSANRMKGLLFLRICLENLYS